MQRYLVFPEDVYEVYKKRAGALNRQLDDKKVKLGNILDAFAKAAGLSNSHVLKAKLSEFAGADVRFIDSDEPARLDAEQVKLIYDLLLLHRNLAQVESLSNHGWQRLYLFLTSAAKHLQLRNPALVLDAAARAWCEAADWAEVAQRIRIRPDAPASRKGVLQPLQQPRAEGGVTDSSTG